MRGNHENSRQFLAILRNPGEHVEWNHFCLNIKGKGDARSLKGTSRGPLDY